MPNFKVIGLHARILWQFLQVCKKKKKVVSLYFRNGWGDFPQIWYVVSPVSPHLQIGTLFFV